MKYLVFSLLLLAGCGGGGGSPPLWPDHDVAPVAGLIDPIDDLFLMDTDSDRFGVGYFGSDELVAIAYARSAGARWTWFLGAHAAANEPYVAPVEENPAPGLLYVYAIGMWGTEYLTLVDYEPGVVDGCYLSRNNSWLEAR